MLHPRHRLLRLCLADHLPHLRCWQGFLPVELPDCCAGGVLQQFWSSGAVQFYVCDLLGAEYLYFLHWGAGMGGQRLCERVFLR